MVQYQGIVDLHHHLLPGVDDGAKDMTAAMAMAGEAVREGITRIVCTPHTLDGCYDVTRQRARLAFSELSAAVAAAGLALELRLAGEVHLHQSIPDLLAESPDVSLDGKGRYLLLELPHHVLPPSLPTFLFSLRASGVTPVIAHPERNLAVREDPQLAAEFVRAGALLQLTAGSLISTFGPKIESCAIHLLQSGLVHVLASDAHSMEKRAPRMQQALAAAARLVGEEGARRLALDNPAHITAGEDRELVQAPPMVRRKSWFSWGRR